MTLNNIEIVECGNGGNQYLLYTQQGIQIGILLMPLDKQKMADAKALDSITKTISGRWGLSGKKN